MSTSGATNYNKHLSSGPDHSQKGFDMEAASVKLRERERFFEEVLQHDVDIYLSANHLHINSRKPPMESISSLEVNVDILEHIDLMEISDHEALDVFLNSGNDNSVLTTTLQEEDNEELEDDDDGEVVFRQKRKQIKSRTSSTSTLSSKGDSDGGRDTPIIQSDEEEVQVDNFMLTSTTSAVEEHEEEEVEEEEGG
ncbi:dysbindin-like isoform X2 [Colossoma macropomum]|uniref:dysbindin-like isoform X2 n=1 Tax=Colossoma macropomum TaxID=42526 RepID=UPI0018646620|nr:dysbindin-like isoform X2 [Colossoma macropomum]